MSRLQIIAMDQPGWMWRAAFAAVAFILLLPILLLVFLALLTGVIRLRPTGGGGDAHAATARRPAAQRRP